MLGGPSGSGLCGPTDIGSLSWGLHGSSSSHSFATRASPARVFLGRYHRQRSLRDVLLWHELSRGTGPELCSPVKALIAALSGVAQPHRHRCCFCSREACRTAALVVCVWLKAASSFLVRGLYIATAQCSSFCVSTVVFNPRR